MGCNPSKPQDVQPLSAERIERSECLINTADKRLFDLCPIGDLHEASKPEDVKQECNRSLNRSTKEDARVIESPSASSRTECMLDIPNGIDYEPNIVCDHPGSGSYIINENEKKNRVKESNVQMRKNLPQSEQIHLRRTPRSLEKYITICPSEIKEPLGLPCRTNHSRAGLRKPKTPSRSPNKSVSRPSSASAESNGPRKIIRRPNQYLDGNSDRQFKIYDSDIHALNLTGQHKGKSQSTNKLGQSTQRNYNCDEFVQCYSSEEEF